MKLNETTHQAIDYVTAKIYYGMKDLEHYLQTTELLLKREKVMLGSPEDDRPAQNEAAWGYDFEILSPDIQRKSVLIFSLNYLEYNLVRICKILEKPAKLKFKDPKVKGQGIQRAKDYLKKAAKIDISKFPHWSDIILYTHIKSIVNNNYSLLDKTLNNEASLKFTEEIKKTPGIFIEDPKVPLIILEEKFMENFIGDLLRFNQALEEKFDKYFLFGGE